jgi:hypothetical protein
VRCCRAASGHRPAATSPSLRRPGEPEPATQPRSLSHVAWADSEQPACQPEWPSHGHGARALRGCPGHRPGPRSPSGAASDGELCRCFCPEFRVLVRHSGWQGRTGSLLGARRDRCSCGHWIPWRRSVTVATVTVTPSLIQSESESDWPWALRGTSPSQLNLKLEDRVRILTSLRPPSREEKNPSNTIGT